MIRILLTFIIANIGFVNLISQINPFHEYTELFEAVQRNQIFNDQKNFVDCKPLFPVDTIINRYNEQKHEKDFESEIKTSSLVKLYELGKVSSGVAARVLGLSRLDFLELLAKYNVSVLGGYDIDNLNNDIENA